MASARANFNEPAGEPNSPADNSFQDANNGHLSASSANELSDGADDPSDSPMSSSSSQDSDEQGASGAPSGESEDEFECPNNGIFADEPSGCQAYHVCQSGAQVQQKFQCPLGTLFNNIILTCDFAHNVQCGGAKGKQAAQLDAQEPIRQSQPAHLQHQQQHPSQSQAIGQESRAPMTRPAPVYQSQPQHRVAGNSRPGATGPRQLKIGSQYIAPRQQQAARAQPSAAQAVGVYPPSPSPAPRPARPTQASSNNFESNSQADGNSLEENDDDEPLVMLVPATIPPRTLAASAAQQLPYNPPPPASIEPARVQQQQHRQTAHRSQFPQSGGQNYQEPAYFGGHDEASSPSPLAVPGSGASDARQQAALGNNPAGAQHFDLVINHVAPTQQQQQQHHSLPAKLVGDKSSYIVKKQQQQHKKLVTQQAYGTGRQATSSSGTQRIEPTPRTAPPTRLVGQSQRQQQQRSATQQRVFHAEASAAQAGNNQPFRRPPLVDLTNDKQLAGGSISAEALSDGMLLVVRHGPAGAPTSAFQLSGSAEHHPAAAAKLSAGSAAVGGGQAFAVDPSIVRPNAPIDAQLFPNVQRVLASSPQASTRIVQHVDRPQQSSQQHQQQQQQASAQLIGVFSQPLPALEPPKPAMSSDSNQSERRLAENQIPARQHSEQQAINRHSRGEQLDSLASAATSATTKSTTTPTTTTTTTTTTKKPLPDVARQSVAIQQQQQQQQKARPKRNKRLKAVPSPTVPRQQSAIATNSTTATAKSEPVDVVNVATQQPSVSAKISRQDKQANPRQT